MQPAKGKGKMGKPGPQVLPPRNMMPGKGGPDVRAQASSMGQALAAITGPPRSIGGIPGQPPPPGGPFTPNLMGQVAQTLAKAPQLAGQLAAAGSLSNLSPELAALVSAGEVPGDGSATSTLPSPTVIEKKPRIILLLTRLPPLLQDDHMQQILEQCGEVHGWRRGRDTSGQPLSFGFAQFGDAEAAWKVSTCVSKRTICGQEIKVMVEEHAEVIIKQWRAAQKLALRVNTDEELDWELERKSVSCKALIDAKIEEIYGVQEGTSASGGHAEQRKKELRERENVRVERAKKRKAWREEEFGKELSKVEEAEKRLRIAEKEKDEVDRTKEASEAKEKEDQENKVAKVEDTGSRPLQIENSARPDGDALLSLVDQVQAEPRDRLFRMDLDVAWLRNEKIFEKKLRPWLERKIDLFMGGPQSDLVEYILRRVNAASSPDALISDLSRYIDDGAEALVERTWRMLAFELTRGGVGLTKAGGA